MFHKNSQYSRSYSKNEFCKMLNPDWRIVYNQIEVFCKRSVQSYFRCSRLWWILVECDSKQSTPISFIMLLSLVGHNKFVLWKAMTANTSFFLSALVHWCYCADKSRTWQLVCTWFFKSAKFQVNQVSSSSPLNNAQTKPCTWSKATVTGRFSITTKSHHN